MIPVAVPKSKSRLFDYETKHKKEIDAKRTIKFNVAEKPSRPTTAKEKKAEGMDESAK